MKWAEEGYCVVQIQPHAASARALQIAVEALDACAACASPQQRKLGLVSYDVALWWSHAAEAVEGLKERIVVVAHYALGSQFSRLETVRKGVPTIYHLVVGVGPAAEEEEFCQAEFSKAKAKAKATTSQCKVYEYGAAMASSAFFAVPFHEEWKYATEAISHSRNLAFLKPVMGGPYFDLELLWDEHTYYEFENRSVENTMATMVEEPYVNHVPTVSDMSFSPPPYSSPSPPFFSLVHVCAYVLFFSVLFCSLS
jgi:carboxymethylenebutenolidase